jgi:neutral ceramidase
VVYWCLWRSFFQQTYDLRDIRIADYAKRGEDISNKMPPGGTGLDRSNKEVNRLMDEQKQMLNTMGQMLGEEVKQVIRSMRRFETQVSIKSGRKVVEAPGRRLLNREGRAGYEGRNEDAAPVPIRLSLLMIDDIPITAVNGEVYNFIA